MPNLVKVKINTCTDPNDTYKHLVGDHGLVYDDGGTYYRIPHVNIKVKKVDCEFCDTLGRNF